jgi:hypothetical protein
VAWVLVRKELGWKSIDLSYLIVISGLHLIRVSDKDMGSRMFKKNER